MTSLGWAYYFPDDDLATFEQIAFALPDGLALRFEPNFGWGWLLELTDFAAVHLKLAGLGTWQGEYRLAANECWILFDKRAECEASLADANHPTGTWTHLVPIRFADEEAKTLWDAIAFPLWS